MTQSDNHKNEVSQKKKEDKNTLQTKLLNALKTLKVNKVKVLSNLGCRIVLDSIFSQGREFGDQPTKAIPNLREYI